jgi:hypothetical protein
MSNQSTEKTHIFPEVKETVEDVMKDLEQNVNPKNVSEGIASLVSSIKNNDASNLLGPMQQGAEEFKARTGRNMTYSEMRMMWG